MPTKSDFVGYHKSSGEKVFRIYNPVGLMSTYFVENGEGPYAGQEVKVNMIITEANEKAAVVEEQKAPVMEAGHSFDEPVVDEDY